MRLVSIASSLSACSLIHRHVAANMLEVGARVEVAGKDVCGRVAYMGTTTFSSGRWVGVVLDEPKGKNNGTVQGRTYFSCADNHGIFVRQSQLKLLDEPTDGTEATKPLVTTTPGPAAEPVAEPVAQEQALTWLLEPSREVEALRAQVQDLQEKLDTMMHKRQELKAQLRDYERTRLQVQQLLEFKAKIGESQAELQRQLAQARREAQEAHEERERHAEEVVDLADTIEMATVEKEMAEEKLEQLQQEVDHWKEKYEMLELDHKILTSELSTGEPNSYRERQLEQENEKMREALVRLRDLTTQLKHEKQQLKRELDQRCDEVVELTRMKQALEERQQQTECTVAELQEQLDMALGAEQMVEHLTEKNLDLEEVLRDLREELNDYEKLHDLNEQLQEQARETELELREELSQAQVRAADAQRRVEAAHEALADCEQTVAKYRALVAQLREQTLGLEQQLQAEPAQLAPPAEVSGLALRLAQSKAHTRAIDLELRRLEVAQANRHVEYLSAFLTEGFLAHEHDGVLMVLLVSRVAAKCDILASQLQQRHATPPGPTSETSEAIQFAHAGLTRFLLCRLQGLLHQYGTALETCSVELFTKTATLYPEMLVHEKLVDLYLQLLRKDELDENIPLGHLERALSYFESLYAVHLSGELRDDGQLLADGLRCLGLACEAVQCALGWVRRLLSSDAGDLAALLDAALASAAEALQGTRKLRRRLPTDDAPVALSGPAREQLEANVRSLGQVLQAACSLQRAVAARAEQDAPLPADKLKELAHEATDRVYGKEDQGPDCLRDALAGVAASLDSIGDALQPLKDAPPKPPAPLHLRAQASRQQARDLQALRAKLEAREADIVALKTALKIKSEEYSEMHVRKDMAEKKLGMLTRDSDDRADKVQRQLDETKMLLLRKEKEFEESMDHLQADIDALEAERGELKDKLKAFSKKTLYKGLSETVGLPASASWPQLQDVKAALRQVQRERSTLGQERLARLVGSLRPLGGRRKEQQRQVCTKAGRAITQAVSLCVEARVVDLIRKPEVPWGPLLQACLLLQDSKQELTAVRAATVGRVASRWRAFPHPAVVRLLQA
ncbi:dynactin subunit 1 isoform X2 [Ixodes scapularis]|uniref:dynactin subunit 1 isoform X2 n=1 Tax=Ixodes scapularis TaxID=6945 RepID=UPI001A9F27C9|nr:dynactin subunit 1 isoform X2 [Ixodes scapularis]